MDNSNFINLMKRQQEMIQNQQAQISQLLEMQQRQNMENEIKNMSRIQIQHMNVKYNMRIKVVNLILK